jgi:Holliday junction resolvase RusA-like endonuclease
VEITNFYRSDVIDVDNVIKPILDAMKGLVYADDKQVISVISRKRSLAESLRIEVRTSAIETALSQGIEFVYVVIRFAAEFKGATT